MALTGESAAELCSKPPVQDVLEREESLREAYAERFEAFRRLYQALEPEFRRAAKARDHCKA
jgi:sugar (pentulose or hexulose) kinase